MMIHDLNLFYNEKSTNNALRKAWESLIIILSP